MQEEVGFIESVFSWVNEHAAWFVPLVGAVVALMYRIHRYFTGLNRIADQVEKMMTTEQVDQRVDPVISEVNHIKAELNEVKQDTKKIIEHLLNRPKNQRSDD